MDQLHDHFDAELASSILHDGVDRTIGIPADLGFVTTELTPGHLRVELEVGPQQLNPFGFAHGAVVSALVDHCLGVVAWPLCPPGHWPATTQFTLHLLAPVRVGPLAAVATVRYRRGTRVIIDVEVLAGDRVVALAQGTVSITAPRVRPT